MKNYHVLTVKYLGPTDYKGSRVVIRSDRFKKSKTLSFDYTTDTLGTAVNYLESKGFDLVGKAEGKDCYYLISNTFETL